MSTMTGVRITQVGGEESVNWNAEGIRLSVPAARTIAHTGEEVCGVESVLRVLDGEGDEYGRRQAEASVVSHSLEELGGEAAILVEISFFESSHLRAHRLVQAWIRETRETIEVAHAMYGVSRYAGSGM